MSTSPTVGSDTRVGELLTLTSAQLGVWNAQRLDPDSRYYLVGEVLEIRGPEPVDVTLLGEAIRATIGEAETMRLRMLDTPDGPRQMVSQDPVEPPPIIDLRAERDPVAVAHALVGAIRARESERCRGMVDRRLYSYTLLRLSDHEVWCVQLYHHLIVDGYTAAMLSRRIAAHYTALVRGTTPPPANFGSIADLVAADAAYRASPQFEEDRAYWRDVLSPLPELTGRTSPVDGPPDRTFATRATLPAKTVTRLRHLADDTGTTWAETLIACYGAFLHRLRGESDTVIALPIMARTGAALRTPAMAVNVLPLRVEVRSHDRLPELAQRVAQAMLGMRAHQRYRGEDLPRDLGVPGVGALLHGIGINIKVFDFTLDFAGATGVLRNVAGGPPEDLGLTVTPVDGGALELGFEVDARTTDHATVDRRMAMLVRTIDQLTGPDHPPVGRISMLNTAERDRIGAARSAPAAGELTADVPAEDVPTALQRLVAESPDATALVSGPDRLTVADLGRRVHQLARALRARRIGPDDVVAVALPRSADLVIALLAVLDSGAAYLVLDLEHPAPRLRELLDDARPALLLTTRQHQPPLGKPTPVLLLDTDQATAELAGYPELPLDEDELAAPRHPEQLAYVVYTSGSTGHPKGVLVRNGGLTALLHHHRCTIHAEAARRAGERRLRVAHTASFAFDASVDQLLWLLSGHELHVYDAELQRDAEALVEAFTRDRIDVVDMAPAMAAQLLDHGLLDRAHPVMVLVGGEAVPPALWERIAASGVAAYNMYGPTEFTVDALAAPVDPGAPHIGRPLAGTRVYLLDSGLQPVADGERGELYLAGPQLARGYLGRPDATAERFVPDPFGPPGSRMYRTGDIARFVPGRGFEFCGRSDAQVKIRGHRVELTEVEAAIAAVDGVGAAAAVVRTDSGRPRLVGYAVPAPGAGPLTPEGIRRALAERVPDHLVPPAVVVLDALPVTVNGKLDRAALPAPPAANAGEAPTTDRERTLCEVVAEVLGHPRIGVDDDFFGLGGDSITAISVSARLRARGLELRPKELLSRRPLGALAAAAREIGTQATSSPDVPVGVVPAPPIVRAFLDPNPPEALTGYAQWTVVQPDTPVTPADLRAGVRALLTRHDALRLLLRGQPGSYELIVRETVDDTAIVTETGGDPGEQARRLAAQLDPRTGDVLRVALLAPGPDTPQRVLVVAHHLVVDGVSWRILLADLEEAVGAASEGRPPRLTPAGTSWRRHATLLAEAAAGGTHRGELDHWRGVLADPDEPQLGTRPRDPATDTARTAVRTHTVASPEVTEAILTTLPAAYRADVDEVLLAALVLALRSWRHDREAPRSYRVMLESHGRDPIAPDVDLSGTVGWFTVEFPVRVPATAVASDLDLADALAGGPAAGRLLRAAKEAKRATPRGGIGYGVLRHLDPDTAGELAALPAPEVLLNYLGRFTPAPGATWQLPDGDAFAVVEPSAKALAETLALNAFVHETPAPRLAVEWTVAGEVLDAQAVTELQAHWDAALAALAAHASRAEGGLTPSDCPEAGIDQHGIDELERRHGPLDDILPLSPLQEGLLFHAVRDGAGDVYTLTARFDLAGPLDPERLRAALNQLLRRHPNLRAAFHYEGLDRPVQAIPRRVDLPWRVVDLSMLPEQAALRAADGLEREATQHVFDVTRPPLLRAVLVRLPGGRHRLVLNAHHILTDGWSTPIVVRELLALYHGDQPAAPTPYRSYLSWLAARDRAADRAAWARHLSGAAPTLLTPGHVPERGRTARIPVPLPDEVTEALTALGRRRGLTVNTLVQGAWGLLLAEHTGRVDVVFGATVSGRPADLPGVEEMVGLFSNTLPVRLTVRRDEPVLAALDRLQQDRLALQDHEYAGLADIERAVGSGSLFDTLVVFENFPNPGRGPAAPDELRVERAVHHGVTHYPLTLLALPGSELELVLDHDTAAVPTERAEPLAARLAEILTALVDAPEQRVCELVTLPERPPAPSVTAAPPVAVTPPVTDAPAPETVVAAVCAAAAAVLELPEVAPDDNFFTLGGHSLTAMRLVGRLRRDGIRASVPQVFETTTLAELASRVEVTDPAVTPPTVDTPGPVAAPTPGLTIRPQPARRETTPPGVAVRFAEQVARTPNTPALVCAGETVSYRELGERVDTLARRLVAAGAGPERLVADTLARRRRAAPMPGPGGRAARSAPRRRRLPATGHRPPGRAARVRALRRRSSMRGDLHRGRRPAAGERPRRDPHRGHHGPRPRHRAGRPATRRGAPRLRAAHLRLHRPTQGGRGHHREPRGVHRDRARRPLDRPRGPGRRGHHRVVRHRSTRAALPAPDRRHRGARRPVDGPRSRRPARAHRRRACHHAAGRPLAVAGAGRPPRRRRLARCAGARRRGGAATGPRRGPHPALRLGPQRLRPHRGHGVGHRCRPRPRRPGDDRRALDRRDRPGARREAARGPRRRARRAVPRRRPGRARLPQPARAHRHPVRRRPGGARGTDVPHRRPGAPGGRAAGVPVPCRRPGQGPRVPRRAR